jgi:N-carbamoyl-L-amino-acid hydrolase
MLGSLVHVGGLALEHALDIRAVDDDARLGDELARIGYAGPLPTPAARFPHAFVELHIEQGPILEDEGITIGVVEGVQGISWTELVLTGQSAHAGTTPMRLRRDPLLAGARIVDAARSIATELGGAQVATVGRFEPHPDLVNVVAQQVTLTLDLRNTSDAELRRAEHRLIERVSDICASEQVLVESRSLARFEPVEFDPTTVELVESVARRLGHSTRRMSSGAGHDAQMLARVCPTAMIFTPSIAGLSHNIAEDTHPGDIAAGADVLLHVLLELASQD